MPKRLQVYETPEITVTFDPNRCFHSGVCVRGLPDVFDIRRKRWVRPELASAQAVAEQVARCPSGALQVQWPAKPGDPESSTPGAE
ncbi:MAG TPA: (4Fe-4S)-binding protein [Gemmatimonadales bacterium]|nr:(4Fe-4S)-binding protein [Gemmatimonadales bacterium]